MSRTQTKYTHQSLLDFHQWCSLFINLSRFLSVYFIIADYLKVFSDRWLQFHGLENKSLFKTNRFRDTFIPASARHFN